MIVRALAPAKLNLYLEVVGKRPDGYHELATLFQTVDWGDDVEVERTATRGVTCTVEGAHDLPADERNLAVRAATAWLAATGAGGGVRLLLRKRIPLGGGLGGGSSDAASVLRALERLGRRERNGETMEGAGAGAPPRALVPEEVLSMAEALGADVPFLLTGGTATATGRGDVIRAIPGQPSLLEVVLVMPPFGTETGKVFARCAERLRRAPADGLARACAALSSGEPAAIRAAHHNDLAEAAMRAYPELLRFTSRCERALGRAPCLTGSGSTLFDVPDPGETADVVARLRDLPGRREVVRMGKVASPLASWDSEPLPPPPP